LPSFFTRIDLGHAFGIAGEAQFGGRLADPRARRGRGSGLAWARKQSEAVIVGGVNLEAAPPAHQDDAETASIIANGRKGLYEQLSRHPCGSGKQHDLRSHS